MATQTRPGSCKYSKALVKLPNFQSTPDRVNLKFNNGDFSQA